MAAYTGLKAWQHARRLAVECARACRTLPRCERSVLGARLRKHAYAAASSIGAAAVSSGPGRLAAIENARKSLAETETLLHVGHDLGYLSNRDFARLEAWCVETGRTFNGLRNKAFGMKIRPAG